MTFEVGGHTRLGSPTRIAYLICPNTPFQPIPEPTTLCRYSDGILTPFYLHRVQEHLNRNSDEEVMTFRSWRSHMTKQSYPDSLPYLPERPFPTGSGTHFHPKTSFWKLDSMGFPWSPRTPKSEFGRRNYDLPKLEVTHD